MTKDYGSELTNSYIEARKKMAIEIPSPEEIMTNKDKYIPQFKEYAQYIKTMSSKDLNTNPYHKYAKNVMKALNINTDKQLGGDDTFKEFMDLIKKNKNVNNDDMGKIFDQVKELSKDLNLDKLINNDELNVDNILKDKMSGLQENVNENENENELNL